MKMSESQVRRMLAVANARLAQVEEEIAVLSNLRKGFEGWLFLYPDYEEDSLEMKQAEEAP